MSVVPVPPASEQEKTRRYRLASRAIIVVTALCWAIYDVFPAVNTGRGDTISENIRDWGRTWWVLPYFFGALTSHFFVNLGQPASYKTLFLVFAGVTVALIGLNTFTRFYLHMEVQPWLRIGVLLAGFAAGMLLWRQNP